MNLVIRRPSHLQEIQEEMNRIFEDFLGETEISKLQKGEMVWKPAVELGEQNGNYQLKAELPGVNKDNIDVEVGEDSVTVKASIEQKEEEKAKNIYRSEIRYGNFVRTIALPSMVDNTNAKAEFKDGILTITIPKSGEEESKIKKLNIE